MIEAYVEASLAQLEAALGHGFASRELLTHALTHRSLANERAASEHGTAQGGDELHDSESNERLEFLGDAVLGLVVAESLFAAHPEWHEGELTRVRARLVSRKHMAEVAMEIGLGGHLRLSRGEDRSGLRNKATVLSNTMEAVMGALFLDGGLEAVRDFVRRCVMGEAAEQLAAELRSGEALGNYKSALQEHTQQGRLGTPVYLVKSESGPDHRKRFQVEVRLKAADEVPGPPLARGKGSTKKLAEQDAARLALQRMKAGEVTAGATAPGAEEEDETAK